MRIWQMYISTLHELFDDEKLRGTVAQLMAQGKHRLGLSCAVCLVGIPIVFGSCSPPIHSLIRANDVEGLKTALCRGADPNYQDDRGTTALHLAAFLGHNEQVIILLDYGANPQIRDMFGLTALHHAFNYEALSVSTVQFLLEKGADPNATDDRGQNASFFAAWAGDCAAFKELAEKGARHDLLNDRGENVLTFVQRVLSVDQSVAETSALRRQEGRQCIIDFLKAAAQNE